MTWLSFGCVLLAITLPSNAQSTWIDKDEAENYTARHEASFVQAGDKFYLFGGRESARKLDAYDFTTNTWASSRDARAPVEFNHFQAIEYEGLIWVIGAFQTNSFPNERPAESVYVFDPANSVWMQGPEIPEDRRRGSTGLVVHDDKFYVVGGNTIGHNGGFVNWFDEYDPQNGTWTALADAPNARDHFHAATADGKLYAVGGRLSGGAGGVFAPLIGDVDVYDFATNSWSTLPAESNLPTPRAAAAVAHFDDKIFVIGGEGNGRAYDTVEALDLETLTWDSVAPLNYARHGTQAIVSGGGIYVAAGSPNQGGGNQKNMEVFHTDTAEGMPSLAGVLTAPNEVSLLAGVPEKIRFEHVAGNEGVFVNQVTLTGDDAEDFIVSSPLTDPFLIVTGGDYELTIEYVGDADTAAASIDFTHSGSQTISVGLTGSRVPEPATSGLTIIAAAVVFARRNQRTRNCQQQRR